MIDLSIFCSKTDTALAGQAAVPTAVMGADRGGIHAFLEATCLGLSAPSPPMAHHPAREIRRGAIELPEWPADFRALATLLYDIGSPNPQSRVPAFCERIH